MQVLALILEQLPSEEALRAACVSRAWRAAAGSLTGLRLSFSIALHTDDLCKSNSATGWSRVLSCMTSPSAAHIRELCLTIYWVDVPLLEAIELPVVGTAAAAASTPLPHLSALQSLQVYFPHLQNRHCNLQSGVLTCLSVDLLGALLRCSPQLKNLVLNMDFRAQFCMDFTSKRWLPPRGIPPPYVDGMGSEMGARSPLEAILSAAPPTSTAVAVRDKDMSQRRVALDVPPRCGQLSTLVVRAPEIALGFYTDAQLPYNRDVLDLRAQPFDDKAGNAPGAEHQRQHGAHNGLKVLLLDTERLDLTDLQLEDLRRLTAACTVLISGFDGAQRPEVQILDSAADADELRAMVDSMN